MSSADIAPAIAEWIFAHQQADGRVRDPMHGDYGTYADGFAALTFALMADRTGEAAWASACERSLLVARSRPIESEFDQLALLLLSARPPVSVVRSPWSVVPKLYHGRRLVSNNWVAMRALNYSLRARLRGSRGDAREAAWLWERVLAWQAADGLFVDSPGGDATPITYHAKFCAMLALALTETDCGTAEMAAALRRGLDALCSLVSLSGVLVPFGRSRNTLFGYAAAILALRRSANLLSRSEYHQVAGLLEGRMARYQRPDGHIPCVLNDGEAEKRDWDVYVNNPDYNAYAAAMLLLSQGDYGLRTTDYGPETTDEGCDIEGVSGQLSVVSGLASAVSGQWPVVRSPSAGVSGQWSVVCGPLLTIRRGDLFAVFATTGQSVPVGTPFFCDHRYYGMQPLCIEMGGQPLFEPEPYAWRGGEDRAALVEPTANPWVPFLVASGRRYCVRAYHAVEMEEVAAGVRIIAEGVPEAYRPVPRWERGLRSPLASLSGWPSPVCRVAALAGVRLRRILLWKPEAGALSAMTEVIGTLPVGARLCQSTQEWRMPSPVASTGALAGNGYSQR